MEALKEMIGKLTSDFNPAVLLPDLAELAGKLSGILRVAVMIAPLVMLGLGLLYFLAAPKEANYSLGYRCLWGMSSVEAWQFTQRLAGGIWSVLGLILCIVMAVQAAKFPGLQPEPMVWAAGKCILWEIGLLVASIVCIDVTLMVMFDRKGIRRAFTVRK